MIETRDLEVCIAEIEELTTEAIEAFVESRINYLVIQNKGQYAGVIDVGALKKNGKWMTAVIQKGQDFVKARKFFEEYENRNQLVAYLDEAGNLMTFLVWNQRAEAEQSFLEKNQRKIAQLLNNGKQVAFEDWDEYTERYVRFCSQERGWAGRIFLSGRNWEISEFYQKYRFVEEIPKGMITVKKDGIFYPSGEPEVLPLLRMKEQFLNKSLYFHLGSTGYLGNVGLAVLPDGYCDLREKKEIDSFMGKEVEDAEAVMHRPDVCIIVLEQLDREILAEVVPEDRILLCWELFEWDREVIEKNRFQGWGTLEEKRRFKKGVENLKVPYCNYKDKNDAAGVLFWEGVADRTPGRFKEYVRQVNANVKLYAKNHMFETSGSESMWFLCRNLDEAIVDKKTCLIYGTQSHYTSRWIHILERMGLSFKLMEEEEGEWNGYSVECVHDLPFYNMDEILVVLNQPYGEVERARQLLENYGISMEEHNCVCIYEQILRQDRGGMMVDISAGWICEKLGTSETPCYWTIGKGGKEDYKIMVVGGSTSANCLYQYRSWPEELYEILKKENRSVTIYNGAVEGYKSIQELAKVMRDVRMIKPDMVISFSGINDVENGPLQGEWSLGAYGKRKRENLFQDWVKNERWMACIAEREGAKFFCFAQPQFHLFKNLSRYGKMITARIRRHRKQFIDLEWNRKINEWGG